MLSFHKPACDFSAEHKVNHNYTHMAVLSEHEVHPSRFGNVIRSWGKAFNVFQGRSPNIRGRLLHENSPERLCSARKVQHVNGVQLTKDLQPQA